MLSSMRNSLIWLPEYIKQCLFSASIETKHVYFCVCDHFEPYNNKPDQATAYKRIKKWVDLYPGIVDSFKDSDGNKFRYSFFYPQEEYSKSDMSLLAELCVGGYGEVEIHLHHDNDTSKNLRYSLLDFKNKLHEYHGLLPIDKLNGNVSYGFIHGNWALDNSRRDGRWCGVNDELTILQETGCYADFTMPSAPHETQTRKINSIYYATDDPLRPKSHNTGTNVKVGNTGEGLLMVQGPLGLNWSNRKYGIIPRIENGGLYPKHPVTKDRIACWLNDRVMVEGVDDVIFVKLYNHGAYEEMIKQFLQRGGLATLLESLIEICAERGLFLHFVTAREMVNVILAMESGNPSHENLTDFRYTINF